MKIVALVFMLALTVDPLLSVTNDDQYPTLVELSRMLHDVQRNISRWPLMWPTDLALPACLHTGNRTKDDLCRNASKPCPW